MKKTTYLLFALVLAAGPLLADGRLSSVSVSENGTVMLTTGSPSEFKSSWTGQAGNFKMQIELPGVTVDKTAKVLGNLTANRGIKSVRFSQFQTEPPVARVVIETTERLSYSWSTKSEGVELHFMLPSPMAIAAGTAPATGFSVPSSVFSQLSEGEQPAATVKRMAPPPASSARQATETIVAPKGEKADAKVSAVTVKKPSTAVSSSTPKAGVTAGTTPVGATEKQPVTAATVKPVGTTPATVGTAKPVATTPAANTSVETTKAAPSGQQKDSAAPTTGAVSTQAEKTGTTTPAKSTPSAGPPLAPTSGGTGVVVKPTSPVSGKPTPTVSAPTPAEKPKTSMTGPTVSGPGTAPKTVTGTAATPAAPSATVKPAGPAPTPPPGTKPAETSKPTGKTVAKPATAAPPTAEITTDTADQEKFKEQLKKALGKIETPATSEAKPAEAGKKGTIPTGKGTETSFQEQLKKALDPAKSLADTGEVADVDDIDTDLPATDEEEENPYDTTFAFPGGTFMQVSPSRKVIRYHSEGRRDPFSPLTGRDRYASGKKRRAVPAAEQLRLVGIMRSLAGNKALLEDGEGNGYILAPGDRVRNGYLVSVSENKVLFQVTEYGWTKTVAMELGTLE